MTGATDDRNNVGEKLSDFGLFWSIPTSLIDRMDVKMRMRGTKGYSSFEIELLENAYQSWWAAGSIFEYVPLDFKWKMFHSFLASGYMKCTTNVVIKQNVGAEAGRLLWIPVSQDSTPKVLRHVTHTCNLSIWEVVAGGSRDPGQS